MQVTGTLPAASQLYEQMWQSKIKKIRTNPDKHGTVRICFFNGLSGKRTRICRSKKWIHFIVFCTLCGTRKHALLAKASKIRFDFIPVLDQASHKQVEQACVKRSTLFDDFRILDNRRNNRNIRENGFLVQTAVDKS